MIDQIICFVIGVFIGAFVSIFTLSLMAVSRRSDESGVDEGEVLDRLKKGFEEELKKRAKENDK